MPFLKKTIIWAVFLATMYFGGAGAQSSNNFFQGMGFFSMVAAGISLYVIFKMMWGILGNFSRALLICGVLFYAAFSIGLFNGNTLQSFLNGTSNSEALMSDLSKNEQQTIDELGIQMFGGSDNATVPTSAENTIVNNASKVSENDNGTKIQVYSSTSKGGTWSKIKSWFGGAPSGNSEKLNLMKYPEIHGHPKVISGSILVVDGIKVKLFGIEAPEPTQTCENKYGNSYICGKESIIWMRDFLNKKDVSCRLISKVKNDWTTGICFSDNGKNDVAAAIVNAGWAVSYTEHTQIYVPYEQKAAAARRGLWAGRFYKPWDWRTLQNRKVNIKVKLPQSKSKLFNFKGLF